MFSVFKNSVAILVLGSTLMAPAHAMRPLKLQSKPSSTETGVLCSDFRKNSVFNRLFMNYIQKGTDLKSVDKPCDSIMIYHLSRFYNMMKFFVDEKKAFSFPQRVSSDLVLSLIDYIRNYRLNGSGVSVCELYFLTLECIARVHGNRLPDFRDMGFRPSEGEILSVSINEFKAFLVNSLENLYREMI